MPETIKIDIWGQIEGESDNYRIKPPERVDIDAPALGNGKTYERFYKECPCAFHRTTTITEGGRLVVQKEVAYNDWEVRSSLADSEFHPINESPISVLRQEIFYEGGTQTMTQVSGESAVKVLVGGTLRYGTDAPAFVSSSYLGGAVTIDSAGNLTSEISGAGTYNITAFLTAKLAKPVPVPIVITVTNS